MVVYEVNCALDKAINEEFIEWLPQHIREVLSIDGFISAETYQILEDDQLTARENCVGTSIRYYVKDEKSLSNYLDNHAARLRQEGKDRFADQLRAYRRVLIKNG